LSAGAIIKKILPLGFVTRVKSLKQQHTSIYWISLYEKN